MLETIILYLIPFFTVQTKRLPTVTVPTRSDSGIRGDLWPNPSPGAQALLVTSPQALPLAVALAVALAAPGAGGTHKEDQKGAGLNMAYPIPIGFRKLLDTLGMMFIYSWNLAPLQLLVSCEPTFPAGRIPTNLLGSFASPRSSMPCPTIPDL